MAKTSSSKKFSKKTEEAATVADSQSPYQKRWYPIHPCSGSLRNRPETHQASREREQGEAHDTRKKKKLCASIIAGLSPAPPPVPGPPCSTTPELRYKTHVSNVTPAVKKHQQQKSSGHAPYLPSTQAGAHTEYIPKRWTCMLSSKNIISYTFYTPPAKSIPNVTPSTKNGGWHRYYGTPPCFIFS